MGSWSQARWRAQMERTQARVTQGQRTDLEMKITLPRLECLMKPHPDSDPSPTIFNGHRVPARSFTFFFEPKDGRQELRLVLPAANRFGEHLREPCIAAVGQPCDVVFERGRRIIVTENNGPLLRFMRINVPRWFRPATRHDEPNDEE